MFIISVIKKSIIHARTSLRILILTSIAAFIIVGILAFFFKSVYVVTYKGEFIGYCDSKSKLQDRINKYIENGNSDNENLAYVEIEEMPKYSHTFLKRSIKTNDDEIYNAVTSTGIFYYNYFAIQLNNEDKYYVSKYTEAEEVINKLKEKDSNNIDKISILEKYNTEIARFTGIDDCVNGLYEKKVVKQVVKTKPKTSYNGSGTNSYSPSLGMSFVEPAQGVISSRFGIRSRDNHKGLDIAGPMGSPIVAAAGGTVVQATYNRGGYGNLVVIDHGNGVQTYYGHNSKLCVSVGETVSQGQLIALMGSTGISTGSHCHWEVRVNGVARNPQSYAYKGR